MKDWLYPKGAKYDKVKIATQQKGYRGAIALKSIKVCLFLNNRNHKQSYSSPNHNFSLCNWPDKTRFPSN